MYYYFEALKKYAVFSGRASRKEYWMFFLINAIIYAILMIIGGSFSGNARSNENVLAFIYQLVISIPALAVGIRRMHDVGKNGWYIIVPIYDLILLCTDGSRGDNEYGSNPKMEDKNTDQVYSDNRSFVPMGEFERPNKKTMTMGLRDDMKHCGQCNNKTEKDDKFCNRCGHEIDVPSKAFVLAKPIVLQKKKTEQASLSTIPKKVFFIPVVITVIGVALFVIIMNESFDDSVKTPSFSSVITPDAPAETTIPPVFEPSTLQMSSPTKTNDSLPSEPLTKKPEETEIILGSTEVVLDDMPIRFSELSLHSFGSTVTNDFGYTSYKSASTLGQYIGVAFTINNSFNAQQTIVLSGFQLKDQHGRVYTPERAYGCEGTLITNQTAVSFKPGIPCNWSMLFEVAKDSSSYSLLLKVKPCTETWCALATMRAHELQ
jgi:uncharacterized membrane protein YhaH (DUF805 family)